MSIASVLLVSLSLLASASWATAPARAQVDCTGAVSGEGEALYWDFVPGIGQCNFTGDDGDPMVGAMNTADFAASEFCGRWVRVTGPLGSVDVRIVDSCPDCGERGIDLNRPAFEQIGDVHVGAVPVAWETIPAPDPGNIQIYVDEFSGPSYVRLQVRSHRYGIASVEYLGGGGTVNLPRQIINMFVLNSSSGIDPPYDDPFTLRVTDVHGQSVVIGGIPLVGNSTFTSSEQFPECTSVTAAQRIPIVRGLALRNAVPNPFNPSTELTFELVRTGTVTLTIHDVSGRLVRTLIDAVVPRGVHRVLWNGTDQSGSRAASGVYIARLRSGDEENSRPLALLK